MRTKLVFIIPIVALASAAQTPPALRAVEAPTVSGANSYYVGNRAPLAPNPLIKLPLGSVRPEGWLRRQLTLETKGFSGKLEEISQFCKFEGNEWTSPAGQGKFGWEEVPYWLRGYLDLGYVLGDQAIIGRANQWLNAVIVDPAAQRLFRQPEQYRWRTNQRHAEPYARPVAEHDDALPVALALRGHRRSAHHTLPDEILPLADDHSARRLSFRKLAEAARRRQPGLHLLALQPHRRSRGFSTSRG